MQPEVVLQKECEVSYYGIMYRAYLPTFASQIPGRMAKIPWTFAHFAGHISRGFESLKFSLDIHIKTSHKYICVSHSNTYILLNPLISLCQK